MRWIAGLLLMAVIGVAGFWMLTEPDLVDASKLPTADGDIVNGEYIFYASGCASCHARPGAKGDDKLELAGGLGLKTPFGTFYAPNISSDKQHGIGDWTTEQFVNAVMKGVAPDGRHYYPAFPYTSYQNMTLKDVVDLKAFMDTLPGIATDAPPHDLAFPYRFRRGVGLWKRLFMDNSALSTHRDADAQITRGAYLVHGLGHCGECHTPRNFLGGLDMNWAFAGAPDPEGDGYVPNLTPHEHGIGGWSTNDIKSALKTGILPDYDTFGGSMIPVQENMAKLTDEDLDAIAAYLKTLAPKPSQWRKTSNGVE